MNTIFKNEPMGKMLDLDVKITFQRCSKCFQRCPKSLYALVSLLFYSRVHKHWPEVVKTATVLKKYTFIISVLVIRSLSDGNLPLGYDISHCDEVCV